MKPMKTTITFGVENGYVTWQAIFLNLAKKKKSNLRDYDAIFWRGKISRVVKKAIRTML